jgi:hypothetical protein
LKVGLLYGYKFQTLIRGEENVIVLFFSSTNPPLTVLNCSPGNNAPAKTYPALSSGFAFKE